MKKSMIVCGKALFGLIVAVSYTHLGNVMGQFQVIGKKIAGEKIDGSGPQKGIEPDEVQFMSDRQLFKGRQQIV